MLFRIPFWVLSLFSVWSCRCPEPNRKKKMVEKKSGNAIRFLSSLSSSSFTIISIEMRILFIYCPDFMFSAGQVIYFYLSLVDVKCYCPLFFSTGKCPFQFWISLFSINYLNLYLLSYEFTSKLKKSLAYTYT